MNSLVFSLGLNFLLAVGMFAVFLTVFGLLAPKEKKDELMDISVRRFKSTSSFSRLRPDEKFLDRLAVFCLHNFHLESSLEEMHMQLGSPDKPQPVDILYAKIIYALVIPAGMMLLFQVVYYAFYYFPIRIIMSVTYKNIK